MHFTMKIMDTAIVLAAISIGAPANTPSPKAEGWAQFCSDTNCSENCGISVAIDNPDSLRQVGRKSVKLHGLFTFGAKALIASPGETCDCESSCIDGIPGEQDRKSVV